MKIDLSQLYRPAEWLGALYLSGYKWFAAISAAPIIAPLVALVVAVFHDAASAVAITLLLVGFDTILGLMVAWMRAKKDPKNGLSSRKFGRIFPKLTFYACTLLAAYAVRSNPLLSWADVAIVAVIWAREVLSILEKGAALKVFPVPDGLRKRLALIAELETEEQKGREPN